MSTFNQIINEDQAVLIDFFATWCGPCKMMPPILDQVKKNLGSQLRILKIDVDKNPKVAEQYQVRGVPTLILFKAGKILWRQSGVQDASTLIQIVKQHL
ncbi:thioredoxin [Flavobacteriaceae bacterium]|jgi:thioredoxin 1|nr:thioredoxin [Flavobacteriaceae bacterium]MDA7711223.1 thioredoxin [Flavobacteriaceae bacterium]MDA8900480.1 thioredoxin [Flavobacteriaceae bacterium]MDA8993459.1 thioredoxin [Flavobacteriaceae bacterium]